ncbi:nuclear transport factor 2 family protein [Natronorubrum sp. FCH18a]|uniref:nuclear transport factor 2 family protein n=1 Tax=Natronorubrum sp. FCH18a TaxID=3447018 RepID=UPI003F511B8E
MTTDDLKLLDKFQEAAGGDEPDIETMRDLTHPDCTMTQPESLPYGGTLEGKSIWEEEFSAFAEEYEKFDFERRWMEQAGDWVAIYFDINGKVADGDEFDTSAVELFRVENDQIVEAEVFYKDTAKLIEAGL